MRGKLGLFLLVGALILGSAAGCKKGGELRGNGPENTKAPDTTDGAGTGKKQETSGKPKGDKIVPQEYSKGGRDYMLTEKGWYFVSNGIFYYYDFSAKKELPLCNKPECRHDGNAFCVASNARYRYSDYCLYSDRIYTAAVEKTETQYLCKLLSLALDGSEMHEVATCLELELTENLNFYVQNLFIHQNKAWILYIATGMDLDDAWYTGTAIIDLDTKKVSYFDDAPIGPQNRSISGLKGYGNYIFYCSPDGKKMVLYRYDITDGTEEVCGLMTGFQGVYELLDENTVLHVGTYKNKLYIYHHLTGENELAGEANIPKTAEGELGKYAEAFGYGIGIERIVTDGEYFYCHSCGCPAMLSYLEGEERVEITMEPLVIFDKNFETMRIVNMNPYYKKVYQEIDRSMRGVTVTGNVGLTFLGNEIYWETTDLRQPYRYFYRLRRSDLLAGEPVLEEVRVQKN